MAERSVTDPNYLKRVTLWGPQGARSGIPLTPYPHPRERGLRVWILELAWVQTLSLQPP